MLDDSRYTSTTGSDLLAVTADAVPGDQFVVSQVQARRGFERAPQVPNPAT
jgi:hypothetical protein